MIPAPTAGAWPDRVDGADWAGIAAEVGELGGALTPRLLTPAECHALAGLYDHEGRFRSVVDMERYRFGAGEYKYFAPPLPEPVEQLKQALYPRLLPIARDWYDRLGRWRRGRTASMSGWPCATRPGRPSPPPSC